MVVFVLTLHRTDPWSPGLALPMLHAIIIGWQLRSGANHDRRSLFFFRQSHWCGDGGNSDGWATVELQWRNGKRSVADQGTVVVLWFTGTANNMYNHNHNKLVRKKGGLKQRMYVDKIQSRGEYTNGTPRETRTGDATRLDSSSFFLGSLCVVLDKDVHANSVVRKYTGLHLWPCPGMMSFGCPQSSSSHNTVHREGERDHRNTDMMPKYSNHSSDAMKVAPVLDELTPRATM